MACCLGYILQFSSATLSMGRELADTDSGTGFQDAITPPWETKFALLVFGGSIVVVGIMWWHLGWLSAIGGAAVIVFGAFVAKLILAKTTENHYKMLILQSMCSRYANYVRDGDSLRADAMKQLLIKAGIDPDAMKSA